MHKFFTMLAGVFLGIVIGTGTVAASNLVYCGVLSDEITSYSLAGCTRLYKEEERDVRWSDFNQSTPDGIGTGACYGDGVEFPHIECWPQFYTPQKEEGDSFASWSQTIKNQQVDATDPFAPFCKDDGTPHESDLFHSCSDPGVENQW